MKKIILLIVMVLLLTSCGYKLELKTPTPERIIETVIVTVEVPAKAEATPEPTVAPATGGGNDSGYYPAHLSFSYQGEGPGTSVEVDVMIREMTLDEFWATKPSPNKFVYSSGLDQVAYMWIPAGLTGCTGGQPNLDPSNFTVYYEVSLPESDDWQPGDVMALSRAMDNFLGVKNNNMCAMSPDAEQLYFGGQEPQAQTIEPTTQPPTPVVAPKKKKKAPPPPPVFG